MCLQLLSFNRNRHEFDTVDDKVSIPRVNIEFWRDKLVGISSVLPVKNREWVSPHREG